MINLNEAYSEFWQDLLRDAQASGEPQQFCFFDAFAPVATENGDCADLTYAPVRRDGAQGFQVDGFALELDRSELHLAVSDFRPERELQSLTQAQIEALYRRAERFVAAALTPGFLSGLEETSPAFQVAYPIFEARNEIGRVRIILFSNARLASRKKGVDTKECDGRSFTYNLLDFGRYSDIVSSSRTTEPIEIDVADLDEGALPCLLVHAGEGRYASYLIAMPGRLLAKIYGLYGPRLLEQNVRTFLQARTKVNKGILETITTAPEMFFAYNNGITATASDVVATCGPHGVLEMKSIRDLQIVNGGQTTASILYARDQQKADLELVCVQMKLSVVDPAELDDVVPRISRFANTQNRITEADFFSGHPFHLEIEKISRRLSAPQLPGAFSASKWFYERARGQYRDSLAYGTGAARKRFQAEYPKDQLVVKTDLAKSEMTFMCQPHVVSQGAQKCFLRFAEHIANEWDRNANQFHDGYFKDAVARTIVFRRTDQLIAKADWYRADRGYKANIATYTVAWLVQELERRGGLRLDLQQIWGRQEIEALLEMALSRVAARVAAEIKRTPPGVKNVSEYCKRQACWAAVSRMQIELGVDVSALVVDRQESKQRGREARVDKKLVDEVQLDILIAKLVPRAAQVRAAAEHERLLSPKSSAALNKLSRGSTGLTKSEKRALAHLLENLEAAGHVLDWPNKPGGA